MQILVLVSQLTSFKQIIFIYYLNIDVNHPVKYICIDRTTKSFQIWAALVRCDKYLGEWIIITVIIHQIFPLARDWSKHVMWLNIPQLKLGNIREYSPFFQNCTRCKKDLKNNKHNSLHFGRKYALIFVLGHYLLLKAHSFPRATLSENCSLLGTNNVCRQIFEHIFLPNGGYLFI